MSEMNRVETPKARKEYRCEWCYGPIPQGEKHYHFIGLWKGEFQNWRMHGECFDAQQSHPYSNEGFMPGEGEMPERIKLLSKIGDQ